MAAEEVPGRASPSKPLLSRLGRSGTLLALGGVAGIIVAFLPLFSVSMEMMGFLSVGQTAMVVDDWRGKIGLAGYLAAVVLAFALYPPGGLTRKALGWAGLGVGLLVLVLAVWLLVATLNARGGADLMGMASTRATVGVGAFLNVLAGAAVAAGGLFKAREEKLV